MIRNCLEFSRTNKTNLQLVFADQKFQPQQQLKSQVADSRAGGGLEDIVSN